jgi:hypothetical protein
MNFAHTFDNDQDKLFDLILHFNTSVANERWLLYSTINGDIMMLNCSSTSYTPTVLISQSQLGLTRKARGFSLSINPVTQTPEILCCASSETVANLVGLVSINSSLSYEFIDLSNIEGFLGVSYAEYCPYNNKVYMWGQLYGVNQCLKVIDRTTLNQFREYQENYISNFLFDRPVINQANGDALMSFMCGWPLIYRMYIYHITDTWYQTWDVPRLIEEYHAIGSIKWFIDSSNSEQFFSIPTSDGTMVLMRPSQDGYSSSFISTGKEYLRIKNSNNGSSIYGWYPNSTYKRLNPLFIMNSATGSTVTVDLASPFRSFGIEESTGNLLIPQVNSLYQNNIYKINGANGQFIEDITINAPIQISDVWCKGNLIWYIYGGGSDYRIVLYDISSSSIIASHNPNIDFDVYDVPVTFEYINELDYLVISFSADSNNNLCVYNATTGELIDSQCLDGFVIKSLSVTGGYCYLLTRQGSDGCDKIYRYKFSDHSLSIIYGATCITDVVFSSQSNCLYLLVVDYNGVHDTHVKTYNCSTGTIASMNGIPCVGTNLIFTKSTNRLYVYAPFVNGAEQDGNIALACYDLDDNATLTPTVNLTGLNYLIEPAPNAVFAWTDILAHPETGDLFFVPQRHSTLVSFQDEVDSRKLVAGAWRWISFPQLDRVSNDPVDGPSLFESVTGAGGINFLELLKGNSFISHFDSANGWNPLNFPIISTECVKIYFDTPNQVILPINGTILDRHDAAASFDLISLDLSGTGFQENWIGYWLLDNQDPKDVFGADWDKVESIYAEDWYYRRLVDPRNGSAIAVPSSKTRPLEYGKGYIIKVNQDILGFRWGVTGINLPSYERKEVQNFIYESKPEYEVIDVLDIPSDMTEIGVFDEDICIGAVAVQDSCEQILIYPDTTSPGDPYQFQVISGKSIATIQNYSVYRDSEATFLNGEFGQSQPYSYHCVRLGDRGEEQSIVPADLTVHGNYPNPFNLDTRIAYYLPSESNVEISVYNIKGQLVKSYNRGIEEVGDHFVHWDGKDSNYRDCASGLYFCRISSGSQAIVHKMLLIK